MNASAANSSMLVLQLRDSFSKAVTKNLIILLLGLFINYINRGLIHTFCKHQIFYTNPRYILFIHLVINDLIQVNLSILLFVLSYTVYQVKVYVCWFLLLLALVTTENTPLNLALMALECYVAVCLPLRHLQLCTVRRTRISILLMWTTTVCSSASDLLLTMATQRRAFFSSQVFCLRQTAFPHPIIPRKRDGTYSFFLLLVWVTIFFTYFKILLAAKAVSSDVKKARSTIVLHSFQLLLCMASYLSPSLKDALRKCFPHSYTDTLFASYVLVQILPRSASPVIYGLRDQTFRKYLRRYMFPQGGTTFR